MPEASKPSSTSYCTFALNVISQFELFSSVQCFESDDTTIKVLLRVSISRIDPKMDIELEPDSKSPKTCTTTVEDEDVDDQELEKEKDAEKSTTIPETLPAPNWRKDTRSILLLFFLYILQGIPLGLILTIPFLLLSKGVPYKEQARFSLAFWPFSLKVIYAPIIDAVYFKR